MQMPARLATSVTRFSLAPAAFTTLSLATPPHREGREDFSTSNLALVHGSGDEARLRRDERERDREKEHGRARYERQDDAHRERDEGEREERDLHPHGPVLLLAVERAEALAWLVLLQSLEGLLDVFPRPLGVHGSLGRSL